MVYLYHFDKPISPNHTTQHYLGSTDDLEIRDADHRAGRGARLTQVANERDIDYTVVRTWEGDRKLERQLKNLKNAPKLCPVCNPGVNVHQ